MIYSNCVRLTGGKNATMLDERSELIEKIENMSDEELKDINIFIAGIDVGKQIVLSEENNLRGIK